MTNAASRESSIENQTSFPGPRRPLVGVALPTEHASWRIWAGTAYLLGSAYCSKIRAGSGAPIMLPVGGTDDEADEMVSHLDGLLIPGGPDIEPSRYGQAVHRMAGPFDPDRDRWEAALIRAALAGGIPVLAICRGMQLVNVVLGGSLLQHLPDVVRTEAHNPVRGQFDRHRIRTADAGSLRELLGESAMVPTYHHQGIETVAPGLTPTAWADDGIIEALEDQSRRILAVQWHPEVAESNALFEYFVNGCRERISIPSTQQPIALPESADRPHRQKEFA